LIAARPPSSSRLIACVLVGALLALPPPAGAETPEQTARERFKQGAEAYARRDYRAAAVAFEGAQAALPAGATIYNAALAWLAAGEPVRAGNDFAAALTLGGLSDAQSIDASQRLEAIDKDVGHIDVAGPAGSHVAVDGLSDTAVPARIRTLPGDHYVTLTRSDGTSETRRTHVGHGASDLVDFGAAPPPPAPPPAAPAAPPASPSPTPTEQPAPPAPEAPAASGGSSALRTVGWVGLGTGVALSGVAIGLGVAGLDARNLFVKGGDHDQSLHDRAIAMRTGTNVAWVGAGVIGATGIVLLIVAPRRHAENTAPVDVTLGPSGISLAGRF
jgi:hypothetical protein